MLQFRANEGNINPVKACRHEIEKQTNKIPWEPLGKKKMGFKFTAVWHKNDPYKTENSFLQGKKVKKVNYLTKEGERYEVYLQPCPAKNSPPQCFFVVFRINFTAYCSK